IELLRSSDGTWTVYPELRFACTGLSILNSLRSLVATVRQFTKLSRAKYNPVNPVILKILIQTKGNRIAGTGNNSKFKIQNSHEVDFT
ncbi:MAG: hypothetical protein LBK58_15535, partial [Prevotellaceae bacterium]|nr:hypothetical protein [Prevotellaceae bacterium]